MEPEHIQWNKDDLPDIRDNQRNHEGPVPQGLSFLYDPPGSLREEASAIRQNAEDGRRHHNHGNSEKHPCPPPMQCASGDKEQKRVKRDVEDNTSNDFWSGHRMFGM